jgi:Trk K+ transport system NAD-binding subunit
MEPNLPEFPKQWYLQLLLFAIPIVGLGAIADSVVRLGFLMFSRKQDLPEWQRMVASLYRNHIVVVGVGRVGMRIIRGLVELHEPVVAIESQQRSPLLDELHDQGLPVINGDGRQRNVLLQAGVDKARSVILATSDDLVNLDAGLTARDLNGRARVVLRLFDDTLASKISGAFSLPVISTARVSAPAFIAAATGRQIYQEFQLAGQTVHLVDLRVAGTCSLVGRTVGEVQEERGVNIVMHQGLAGVDVNPDHEVRLAAGDTILVIAPIDRLLGLEAANRPDGAADSRM